MRLGLSAESGFDSLILALNQVNLDSVAKPHSDLGCVGLTNILFVGTFTEGALRT